MHPWYRFCGFCFAFTSAFIIAGRVYNRDRLPDEGAFILAGNHVSFLDPPFFGLACRREAFYMARDTLFENWLGGKILRSWNCVPISRDRGDLGALRTMLRMLKEDKAVLMFPKAPAVPTALYRNRAPASA